MESKPNLFLRLARTNAGLTQEELGEELDLSSQTVYRWEAGIRMPNPSQRRRLCAFFGKSEQELGWPEFEEDEPVSTIRNTLADPSIPLGKPVLAGQHEVLKAIQVSLTSLPHYGIIGLVGLPGCGKTAVATTLLTLPKIQHDFDGILWATLGQSSMPQRHLQRWANLLGLGTLPTDLEKAKEALRTTIGTRKILVVLDDLWNQEDLPAYQVGVQCLLTTRQISLAHKVCNAVYRPQLLSPLQALQILNNALPPVYAREFRPFLETVAAQVGNVPRAIELAAEYLRQEASSDSHRRILAAVKRLTHPSCFLHIQGTVEQSSMSAAIARSELWLPDAARKVLACLAAQFSPAPAAFLESEALEVLQAHDLQAQDLDMLLDAGLLDAIGESRYQFHPIISWYVQEKLNNG